jgi:hypothetical protein
MPERLAVEIHTHLSGAQASPTTKFSPRSRTVPERLLRNQRQSPIPSRWIGFSSKSQSLSENHHNRYDRGNAASSDAGSARLESD